MMQIPWAGFVNACGSEPNTLESLPLPIRPHSRSTQKMVGYPPTFCPSSRILQNKAMTTTDKPTGNGHVGPLMGDTSPLGYDLIDNP